MNDEYRNSSATNVRELARKLICAAVGHECTVIPAETVDRVAALIEASSLRCDTRELALRLHTRKCQSSMSAERVQHRKDACLLDIAECELFLESQTSSLGKVTAEMVKDAEQSWVTYVNIRSSVPPTQSRLEYISAYITAQLAAQSSSPCRHVFSRQSGCCLRCDQPEFPESSSLGTVEKS